MGDERPQGRVVHGQLIENKNNMNELRERSDIRELFFWLIRKRSRFRIQGDSMSPLLNPGDEILVDRTAYRCSSPQIGDIVVAEHPFIRNELIIKRVNRIVEDNRFELVGENSSSSTDSRSYGLIPKHMIIGRVTSRF